MKLGIPCLMVAWCVLKWGEVEVEIFEDQKVWLKRVVIHA